MDKNIKVSSMLGNRFSTNGDLLGVVKPTKVDVAMSRGPIVTSAIRFKEKNSNLIYIIEDSGLPKMFSGISPILSNADLMRRLIGLGEPWIYSRFDAYAKSEFSHSSTKS